MSQSTTTTFRALLMLSCALGITLAALSGTSWTEVLDKFKGIDWPIALTYASASSTKPRPSVAPDVGVMDWDGSPTATPTSPPQPGVLGADDGRGTIPVAGKEPSPPHSPLESDGIQRRLRDLGATYYLLETWGSERKLYRFSCKMAVGGNGDITRYFEAVDTDPLQAMLHVLGQVEPWREGESDHILTLKKIKPCR